MDYYEQMDSYLEQTYEDRYYFEDEQPYPEWLEENLYVEF